MARVTLQSRLLILSSMVLLAATFYYVSAYGQEVYFLAFHRPLHSLQLTSNHQVYTPPVLPVFRVSASIASTQLNVGQTQHIQVSVTSNKTAAGFLEVWITAPNNRQVFQTPAKIETAQPLTFSASHAQSYTYNYMLPASLQPGTYYVSERITSTNLKTDYQVNENFASFRVQ